MINIISGMPGVNCALIGCGSCRRTKGIGIFKLPSAKDDKHKRWRDEWVGELKKTREVDQDNSVFLLFLCKFVEVFVFLWYYRHFENTLLSLW